MPNRFSYHTFKTLTLTEVTHDRHSGYAGRRVADLAREQGKDPFDWLLDFALDDGLDALFDCKLFNTDEDRVKDLLRHPHATLGLSDAGAHLSFLCDAGFGLHLLGHWSRERGDVTLPQAVALVTSRVADAYRIKDRGRLVPGACADLLLFDPDTVGRGEKVRVQDLPTGATRVHTPARGARCVDQRGTGRGRIGTDRGSRNPGEPVARFRGLRSALRATAPTGEQRPCRGAVAVPCPAQVPVVDSGSGPILRIPHGRPFQVGEHPAPQEGPGRQAGQAVHQAHP